jgi:translocator protein
LFRGGCERIGIHGKLGENMVSRCAQARGHSAAVGLRSSLVKSLLANGVGCLASVAAANSRRCVAGIGPVHGAINPQWTLVYCLLRSAKPGAALVEIIVLLAAIAMTAMRFAELSRLAFWLMTPYGAWVLYASYLNFGIWRLNKGTA